MSRTEHALERRSRLLGVGLKKRMETLRDAVAAPGERKPWTEQLTRSEALAFWRVHRFDPQYAQVLAAMKPDDVLALDVELARYADGSQMIDPAEMTREQYMARVNEAEMMGVSDGTV